MNLHSLSLSLALLFPLSISAPTALLSSVGLAWRFLGVPGRLLAHLRGGAVITLDQTPS